MVHFSTYVFFYLSQYCRSVVFGRMAGGYDVAVCKAAVTREHGFYLERRGGRG
jgi:hypothetical protein